MTKVWKVGRDPISCRFGHVEPCYAYRRNNCNLYLSHKQISLAWGIRMARAGRRLGVHRIYGGGDSFNGDGVEEMGSDLVADAPLRARSGWRRAVWGGKSPPVRRQPPRITARYQASYEYKAHHPLPRRVRLSSTIRHLAPSRLLDQRSRLRPSPR
jgi:hypothetical protein